MSFTHLDPGTPEAEWVRAGALELSRLSPDAYVGREVVVLLAHPDDEALGCAALLRHLGDTGSRVSIILCTAGERSHPESPTHTPDELAAIRIAEFESARTHLTGSATSIVLDLGDGRLPAQKDRIRTEAEALMRGRSGPLTLVAPYSRDGHPDHEALGEIALELGRRHAATVLEFPIWYWHRAAPEDPEWRSWTMLPDPEGLDREALWACYPSQTRPLSEHPGDEEILPPRMLAHFDRGGDTYAVTRFSAAGTRLNDAQAAGAVFDAVHRQRVDPWDLRSSAYEIAKRASLLQALPQRRYDHILELGCSVGTLSAELARVGRQVTAVDASAQALETARGLHPNGTGISFVRATIPGEWPAGRFDCVVLSETGYYLSPEQLEATLRRIDASTTRNAVVVLCHWRGAIADWPLDAERVHATALAHWPGARRVHHESSDYRLDVLELTASEAIGQDEA